MSFSERLSVYRRLTTESAAWKLLRAHNAPLVLAFVSEVFSEGVDVQVAQVRAFLEKCLGDWREAGNETEMDASGYLRLWIDAGYLRESDYQLSMTDACQIAVRFADSLDRRELNATASHLRVVQSAVQDLVLQLTGDVTERLKILQARRNQVETEIERLMQGRIDPLPQGQQRERIREVVQLARLLTGDFRLLEDEIRRVDQQLRQQMIAGGQQRGEVMTLLLDQEDLLAKSVAGQAFHGFFELLSDNARSTEFREQLRGVALHEAARFLGSDERRFLGQLMRELSTQSQRVFERRRRTEQSLRSFMESEAHRDDKAIEATLSDLFRVGTCLHRCRGFDARMPTCLVLNAGKARVSTVDSLSLCMPEDAGGTDEVVVHDTRLEIPLELLDNLRTVRPRDIAKTMLDCLQPHGALTLAGIAALAPVTRGLEELVVRMRIAGAVHAIPLGGYEVIEFEERDGSRGRARVPSLTLYADQFPVDLDELDT